MFNFVSIINANDAATQPHAGYAMFIQLFPFILIFIIFYFLLIRPQRKKQAQHKAMITSLKAGDTVLLSSGFKGVITKINEDNFISIEIAKDTIVEVVRSSIINVIK